LKKVFLSSEVAVKIDFIDPQAREIIAKTLKLPINVNYSIENGPLFFKNGFGFGLSRIQNSVNIADYYVESGGIQKYLKSDVIFTSNTTVDFGNNANFEGTTNKIIIDLEGDELEISPLEIVGKIDVETFQGTMNMKIDSIFVEAKDEFFKANNINIDADLKKVFDNGFYLGNFIFNIGKIDTKGADLPFSLEGAKLNMTVDINQNDNETVNIDFKIDGDAGKSKLPEAYASLKKAEVSYSLHGMKLEGLLAFQDYTKELQVKQQDIMARLQSPTTGELDMDVYAELEKMQTETKDEMMLLMLRLLKKDSTRLSFTTNLLDKKNEKSTFSMNMGYAGDMVFPTDAKALEEILKKEWLNLITFDFKVDLEKEYIQNLPVQLQQELAGQLQMGAMLGIVKENNSSFSFDANYKPKKLMLNGQDRTEMLQMLEMGLSKGSLF